MFKKILSAIISLNINFVYANEVELCKTKVLFSSHIPESYTLIYEESKDITKSAKKYWESFVNKDSINLGSTKPYFKNQAKINFENKKEESCIQPVIETMFSIQKVEIRIANEIKEKAIEKYILEHEQKHLQVYLDKENLPEIERIFIDSLTKCELEYNSELSINENVSIINKKIEFCYTKTTKQALNFYQEKNKIIDNPEEYQRIKKLYLSLKDI